MPVNGSQDLLFTSAGMVPLRDCFLGLRDPPQPGPNARPNVLASAQRCLRVNDVENVGRTARHHTYFEMLGNFSFKGQTTPQEAQAMAFDFLTSREWCGIDLNRLHATVHPDDADARMTWQKLGIPNSRIHDYTGNFWTMGGDAATATGPCGPCSEVFYELDTPDSDGEKLLEIWNLVFMMYNRSPEGVLNPLPQPCIDTGMGLERLESVLQGKKSNFEVDALMAVQRAACATLLPGLSTMTEEMDALLLGTPDAKRQILASVLTSSAGHADKLTDEVVERVARAHRVIADHLRACTFLICDGVVPSSVGRGYVLRRLIRRTVKACHDVVSAGRRADDVDFESGKMLVSMLPVLVPDILETYPEIGSRLEVVAAVLENEERAFVRTLLQGLHRAVAAIDGSKSRHLDADVVADLYTRFGFPMDMSAQIALEHGATADVKGATQVLESVRAASRASSSWSGGGAGGERVQRSVPQEVTKWQNDAKMPPSEFIGYDHMEAETEVLRSFVDEKQGLVWISLARSPFYPEGGGQVGDRGFLCIGDVELPVLDTVKAFDGSGGILCCALDPGFEDLLAARTVTARVDPRARRSSQRHHTATHLLQAALRYVLGSKSGKVEDVVYQAGSYVGPDRLRFDFTWPAPLTPEQLSEVQSMVNSFIAHDLPVRVSTETHQRAMESGALGLFGEKYGNQVRVVRVEGVDGLRGSAELCGGTHVTQTGDLGAFVVMSDRSVAVNTRRIEALCGEQAVEWLRSRSQQLSEIASFLEVSDTPLGKSRADVGGEHSALSSIRQMRENLRHAELSVRQLKGKIVDEAQSVEVTTKIDELPMLLRFHFMDDVSRTDLLRKVKVLDSENQFLADVFVSGSTVVVKSHGGASAASVLNGFVFKRLSAGKGGGKGDTAQGEMDDSLKSAKWREKLGGEVTTFAGI